MKSNLIEVKLISYFKQVLNYIKPSSVKLLLLIDYYGKVNISSIIKKVFHNKICGRKQEKLIHIFYIFMYNK